MKKILGFLILITSFGVFAQLGPTSVGVIRLGMNKQEYISAIDISPTICNLLTSDKGLIVRGELKYLDPNNKSLCIDNRLDLSTGTTENIQIGGYSYDVVQANYAASKIVKSLGNNSKAIFIDDKLVSIEIYAPKVNLETLEIKYGTPRLVDKTQSVTCKNRIGNEFENKVGYVDAIWSNNSVNAIFRKKFTEPIKSCTDGLTLIYYIIEEHSQLEPIESIIHKYRNEKAKAIAKDSPF